MQALDWIRTLDLAPHPEGGWFAETHRSRGQMGAAALPTGFTGERAFLTSIYFLLEGHQVSRFHRLRSDEIWYFHAGAPLTLHLLDEMGTRTLPLNGHGAFQQVVTAGCWFGASVDEPQAYTLVGCAVAPGFDFQDFELADAASLLALYPQQEALIRRFT